MFGRLISAFWSVHGGFWLGVLDDRAAEEATAAFYAANPRFLEREHNLSGLYIWEEEIIAKHCPATGRVLVPAAGGGREVLALDAMGYDVVGYDPSRDLVELGNELIRTTGSGAQLLLSDGNRLPEDLPSPFDWVLFGWGGISHVRGSAHRVAVFRAIAHILEPGGILIVSFLHRPEDSRRFTLIHRVASAVRRLMRSHEPIELGDTIDGSFDHHSTFDEIASEVAEAGLTEVERVFSPFSLIVCRKP